MLCDDCSDVAHTVPIPFLAPSSHQLEVGHLGLLFDICLENERGNSSRRKAKRGKVYEQHIHNLTPR